MAIDINTVSITTAGTRVRFSTSDSRPWRVITVSARPANGSAVYVGLSGVTATAGIQLMPGASYPFRVPKEAPDGAGITLMQLYGDAAKSADRLDYFAYSP